MATLGLSIRPPTSSVRAAPAVRGEPARCVSAVVVGMRAAGKSVLGAAAAAYLGLRLVDIDAEVERALKQPIRAFIDAHPDGAVAGWAAFRAEESRQLARAVRAPASGCRRDLTSACSSKIRSTPSSFVAAESWRRRRPARGWQRIRCAFGRNSAALRLSADAAAGGVQSCGDPPQSGRRVRRAAGRQVASWACTSRRRRACCNLRGLPAPGASLRGSCGLRGTGCSSDDSISSAMTAVARGQFDVLPGDTNLAALRLEFVRMVASLMGLSWRLCGSASAAPLREVGATGASPTSHPLFMVAGLLLPVAHAARRGFRSRGGVRIAVYRVRTQRAPRCHARTPPLASVDALELRVDCLRDRALSSVAQQLGACAALIVASGPRALPAVQCACGAGPRCQSSSPCGARARFASPLPRSRRPPLTVPVAQGGNFDDDPAAIVPLMELVGSSVARTRCADDATRRQGRRHGCAFLDVESHWSAAVRQVGGVLVAKHTSVWRGW
jgi:hypothetical protein